MKITLLTFESRGIFGKKKKKLSDIFNHFKRNLLPIRESSKPKKSFFLFWHCKFLQLLGKKKRNCWLSHFKSKEYLTKSKKPEKSFSESWKLSVMDRKLIQNFNCYGHSSETKWHLKERSKRDWNLSWQSINTLTNIWFVQTELKICLIVVSHIKGRNFD